MNTPIFRLLAVTLILFVTSCKKDVQLSKFNFAEKGIVVNCDKFDLKLLNEALFTFENDIVITYGGDKKNLSKAYSQFVRSAVYNSVKYKDITTPHTLEVVKVLKTKTDLWNADNTLNYNSKLFKCLTENIKSNDLKRTIKALTETNTMNKKVFGPAVLSNYRTAVTDKYLATYIALDFFYANLLNIDHVEAAKQ